MRRDTAKEWQEANRRMIAKAIGELSYEGVLQPTEDGTEPGGVRTYALPLASGAIYRFKAWRSLWDHLWLLPETLVREGVSAGPASDAARFFIDSQGETAMSDIVLGNFLEEMHRTLYADMRLAREQAGFTARDMASMDGDAMQSLLDGHPKVLLNKGRIGWGAKDLELYAPEARPSFRLFWIAARRERLREGRSCDEDALLRMTMTESSLARLLEDLRARDLPREAFRLLPVHPWQWEHVIQLHFAGEIAEGHIIPIGLHGDAYRPQVSLRTLTNGDDPMKMNLKLPVSILNTSCVRGIPGRYIQWAPRLSAWLSGICESDPFLRYAGTLVLREPAGLSYQHPAYSQVQDAPYRYHEFLGAIWRESTAFKLSHGDQAILTAALFQRDSRGQALIGEFIRRSGLDTGAWLKAYFERVVLPLYHLQCKYGIGIVAHGQNTVLVLSQGRPAGLLLKDLQGDLRLLDEDLPEHEGLEPDIREGLTRLPAAHLIHDLQTGHFITVLRFISGILQESAGFPEAEFYRILSQTIRTYMAAHPELSLRFRAASLLEPTIPRVVLNPVRFRIGYGDGAERPLPTLGKPLRNPLHFVWADTGVDHGL